MSRLLRTNFLLVAFAASLLSDQTASAAFVTTNEAGMDAVFSQASFGANSIDIRFLPATNLVAPTLLDITTNAEISSLFAMGGASPTVFFFYVDTISACGVSISASIVGCGQRPGNKFVVESAFAAGGFGAELNSHELGHNLGLGHNNGGTFLMNPSLNGGTTLTAPEVATVLASGLIQTDGGGQFIEIQPVLVVAAAGTVPEPSSLALLGMGAIGLIGFRRYRVRNRAA